jgi:hypothetical protein
MWYGSLRTQLRASESRNPMPDPISIILAAVTCLVLWPIIAAFTFKPNVGAFVSAGSNLSDLHRYGLWVAFGWGVILATAGIGLIFAWKLLCGVCALMFLVYVAGLTALLWPRDRTDAAIYIVQLVGGLALLALVCLVVIV